MQRKAQPNRPKIDRTGCDRKRRPKEPIMTRGERTIMSATTRIAIKALALSASSLAFASAAPALAQVEEIIVTA
jgi:hypothetical protein